jgi:putative endonuclease
MVYDHHKIQNIKFKLPRVECPEPVEGQWLVYLLECKDGSLYCGCTDNIVRRLYEHNKGIGAQWTKIRRPLQLVYFEFWNSLLKARQRELQIKGWRNVKKRYLKNLVAKSI